MTKDAVMSLGRRRAGGDGLGGQRTRRTCVDLRCTRRDGFTSALLLLPPFSSATMDPYQDNHYAHQQHSTHDSHNHWPSHLLSPSQHPPFPSPPPTDLPHYPSFYSSQQQHSPGHQPSSQQQQQQQQQPTNPQPPPPRPPGTADQLNRAPAASLSLNLSSLSVASPANLSPITGTGSVPLTVSVATAAAAAVAAANPSAALSPVTPISPNTNPFNAHSHAAAAAAVAAAVTSHHHGHPHHGPGPSAQQQHSHIHHSHIPSPFQFDPVTPSQQAPPSGPGQQQQGQAYDPERAPPTSAAGFDNRRTPGPGASRSSSVSAGSTTQLPRKRSFSNNSGTFVDENMYDVDGRDANMDLTGSCHYTDDMEMRATVYGNSPVDGSGSSGSECGQHNQPSAMTGLTMAASVGGVGGTISVLGKPMANNNFVTKLYQMISDPKSQHFISWTELGTSFVVSNVGEFSRSILGAHFKHNNFSSFVRQLNMYGFHKINRTPRAQRTSTDAQTWEFSHHKFLRGRPDLLDDIKRKALEPDPAMKHRVELPGEASVAAQLTTMRDENRRMWDQLTAERRRVDKLVCVVGRLWDVVGKNLPGGLPPFPPDILDSENPNIFITSPPTSTTSSRFPPPLSISNLTGGSMHIHSINTPSSSPTAPDFPSHLHHNHHNHGHHNHTSLSRQQSVQHISFSRGNGTDSMSTSSTPLQASPRSMQAMDLFDENGSGNANGSGGGTGASGNGTGDHSPNGRGSAKRQRLSMDDGAPYPTGGGMSTPGLNGSSDSLSPLSSSVPSPGIGPGLGLGGLVGIPTGVGMGVGVNGKKSTGPRARSDSAPLGYFGGLTSWGATTAPGGGGNGGLSGIIGRPRSGSGLAGPRVVPNIGSMTRGGGLSSLLTVPGLPSEDAR
ncbi:hypothetical protein AX15_002463 [Amanita polypyramis BW_CC]|nr:hypothetical protein AX15_002463 [Amanita polypyramis BW_CC]